LSVLVSFTSLNSTVFKTMVQFNPIQYRFGLHAVLHFGIQPKAWNRPYGSNSS
jgi:hypothetical protein